MKRAITIYSMNLIEYDLPFFTLRTEVSKGTYVRSLANDVAQRCGSCATTYELARTKIGDIMLDQAVQLNSLTCFEDVKSSMIEFEQLPMLLGVSSEIVEE